MVDVIKFLQALVPFIILLALLFVVYEIGVSVVRKKADDPIYGYFKDVIKPGQRVIFIASGAGFRINVGKFLGVIRKPGTGFNHEYKIEEYVIQLDDKSRTRLHYNKIFADTIQLSDLFGIQF